MHLLPLVALLVAGVVTVLIFKCLGLGFHPRLYQRRQGPRPVRIGIFSELETILHVAELSVVMFLFIIYLKMQPSRL